MSNLNKMTDDELCVWMGGWKLGSPDYLRGHIELERRSFRKQQRVAWISALAAVASAFTSVIVLVFG